MNLTLFVVLFSFVSVVAFSDGPAIGFLLDPATVIAAAKAVTL